ncbi:MAG TPA: sugar phosphate isomerase/epimerase [Armatimonadota bacterium]|jgi:sugar phosphate isomerase/epimerase
MGRVPVGLQLYTVRDECQRDFRGTLEKVARIGYAGVELAGTYGLEAEELRSILDDLGLECFGSHCGERDADKVAEYHRILRCRYVGGPALPPGDFPGDAEGVKGAAQYMDKVGADYLARGLHLYYHNHDHEFRQVEGRYILDLFYENTDPERVQAEIDVFWVAHAGVDPAEYLRKYPGRVPLIHVKDRDESGTFTEVGNGTLDWDAIFAAAEAIGTHWYIVEQDTCQRPCLESAQISLNNLKARGIA